MKRTHFLLVALILCLPFKTFALDVVDATWEDVSPISQEEVGTYSEISLENLDENIYLFRYRDIEGDSTSGSTLSKLNSDSSWSTLLHSSDKYDYNSKIVSGANSLYFRFGSSLTYKIQGGVITSLGLCNNLGSMVKETAMFFPYKKKMYRQCGDLFLVDNQAGETTTFSRLDGTQEIFGFDLFYSAVQFRKKYYIFGMGGEDLISSTGFVFSLKKNVIRRLYEVPHPNGRPVFMDAVVLNDQLYLLVDHQYLYRSDNGESWVLIHIFNNYPKQLILYGDNLLVERKNKLYVLSDNEQWIKLASRGIDISTMSFDYNRTYYTDDHILYLLSSNEGTNNVLYTTDLTTWHQLGDVQFTDVIDLQVTDTYVYIATHDGKVYRTPRID